MPHAFCQQYSRTSFLCIGTAPDLPPKLPWACFRRCALALPPGRITVLVAKQALCIRDDTAAPRHACRRCARLGQSCHGRIGEARPAACQHHGTGGTSNQAATAIWGRLSALPGALNPAGLLALTDEELRQAGLSRPKLRHARALAEAFASNRLSADILAALPDGHAVAAIAEIPGFGPWTAEVHLLFGLDRRDIFPAGDLALAASLAALRGLPDRPKPKELAELAKAWRPWRSMAARLLWHNWRHVTGRPAGEAG